MSTAKAKIYFSVTNDLNHDQRMIRICGSLQKHGYDVSLVGREKQGSQSTVSQSFKQKRLKCFFQSGKFFYLEYNIRLFFFFLFQSRADIYGAVDLDTIGPLALIARLKRSALTFDAHEYFFETPEVTHRPITKSIWKWWAKFWIPSVDLAYTVGPKLAEIFAEIYNIPFHTIRNVPRKVIAMERPAGDKFIILYQGMLNDGRGIAEMMDCMPELKDAELWLAGSGDLIKELKLKAKSIAPDRIKFLGFLNPKELRALTPQASLGINLLEEKGLSYYYSLANKCFDYIQAGVPSINMDFPEYASLNKIYDCLLLVPNLEKDQLVTKIQSLISDKNEYRRLQDNCAKAAIDLCWENEEKLLLKMYASIIENNTEKAV